MGCLIHSTSQRYCSICAVVLLEDSQLNVTLSVSLQFSTVSRLKQLAIPSNEISNLSRVRLRIATQKTFLGLVLTWLAGQSKSFKAFIHRGHDLAQVIVEYAFGLHRSTSGTSGQRVSHECSQRYLDQVERSFESYNGEKYAQTSPWPVSYTIQTSLMMIEQVTQYITTALLLRRP